MGESKHTWQTFTTGSSLTSLRNVGTEDVVSGILSQSFLLHVLASGNFTNFNL